MLDKTMHGDLGRRISEIMSDKGRAYSQQAMSNRIDINRETLRLMLIGKRQIHDYELEKIAEDLKISVSRIMWNDTMETEEELENLLDNLSDNRRAVMIAEDLHDLAWGNTERCHTLNNLGRALYRIREYEEAHDAWLKAYSYGQQIQEKYGDTHLLFSVSKNLILSYTYRKEYSKISDVIRNIEPLFVNGDPESTAAICYSLAKASEEYARIKENEKKDEWLREARRKHYQSLDLYLRTGRRINIGRAKTNTANFEFSTGNHNKAHALFVEALDDLAGDIEGTLICLKELSKTLIKLGEKEIAQKRIKQGLEIIQNSTEDYSEYIPRYYLLYDRSNNTTEYSQVIIEDVSINLELRIAACEYLTHFYEQQGDAALLLKYFRKKETLEEKNYDVLYEGAL